MNREYHRWYSPSLGRDMELLAFGHAGARVVAFPTSKGRFFDWEERGLVAALGEHLDNGWLQLFTLDAVDGESWYAWDKHPAERIRRHVAYDTYVANEVWPFTAHRNPNMFAMTVGASFGGYHAVNFALRHPELVGRTISMSGLCDMSRFFDGHSDENTYLNNPCSYIANEADPGRLALLSRMDIILAIGREDPSCWSNEKLSELLWRRGVGNALRIWDGFAHDWPYWAQMLRLYIAGHD